jgi:hypothetical protein
MTPWSIDSRFSTTANVEVLRFLRSSHPSAHSDVAEELIRSGAGVAGVHRYCPDPAHYAFVALHLDDSTIIGLALGQSRLAFRLPEDRVSEAVRGGGVVDAELGPAWVRFEPWTDEETLAESRRRLARWCAVAACARPA